MGCAPPLTITTSLLPASTAGLLYSANLAASGGTPPYAWALASGSLPPGLTLDASSGLPFPEILLTVLRFFGQDQPKALAVSKS